MKVLRGVREGRVQFLTFDLTVYGGELLYSHMTYDVTSCTCDITSCICDVTSCA